MKYDDGAEIDNSEVSDIRSSGGGGGGMSAGGLNIVGLLIPLLFSRRLGKFTWPVVILAVVGYLVYAKAGGGGHGVSSVFDQAGSSGSSPVASDSETRTCRTGKDANSSQLCAVIADITSIQDYWNDGGYKAIAAHYRGAAAGYTTIKTILFKDQVSTACGAASTDAGPFYCPGDHLVYIDLSFYNQLKTQFGAEGGPLVNAYVLAHEYGHHVQDLLGIESKVKSRAGATSDSVRLELQADCFAGVWMNHATTTPSANGRPLITDITQADIDSAIDTAQRIGDDYIQKNLGGGSVNPDTFTHGTSAERKKWLTTGYRTGDATQCDTFSATSLG